MYVLLTFAPVEKIVHALRESLGIYQARRLASHSHHHTCMHTHTHMQAADANKEDRRPDAQKFHQQAKYCNIAVLVFSVVGIVLLFFGGITAFAVVNAMISSTT